jgi:dsDNA-specific endonuclease/ATPase MutS2
MASLKIDLHPIYNKSDLIDKELKNILRKGIDLNIKEIEIITGKGSGQLKKKVLKFMEKTEFKTSIKRIDKDSKNFGRIFVYLK